MNRGSSIGRDVSKLTNWTSQSELPWGVWGGVWGVPEPLPHDLHRALCLARSAATVLPDVWSVPCSLQVLTGNIRGTGEGRSSSRHPCSCVQGTCPPPQCPLGTPKAGSITA